MSKESYDERKQKIREVYRYDEMSNKVLKADRRLKSGSTDVLTDAAQCHPKSMAGKISIKDMGSSTIPTVTDEEREIARKRIDSNALKTNDSSNPGRKHIHNSTLLSNSSMEKLDYYPTNEFNSKIYEELVYRLSHLLGNDMPHDVIRSATDLLLHILKDDEDERDGNLDSKRKNIEQEFSITIDKQLFNELANLSKKLTDYNALDEENSENEGGVAILASESENDENEEDNALVDEVEEDALEEEEEEEEEEEKSKPTEADNKIPEKDEIFTLSNNGEYQNNDTDIIPIYEVDEFYLQRKLSTELNHLASSSIQNLSDIIFGILGKDMTPAYWESQITKHIDLSHYNLVKFIVHNRDALYWGTEMARASPNERKQLLENMRELDLNFLAEQYESRRMDFKRKISTTIDGEFAQGSDKKRHKDEQMDYKPHIVNLENLAFDQGADLMTTTKITLPADSYKRVKKSYEEIHIPPPNKPSDDFRLISIPELPLWARSAFPSSEAKTLNRIQSEVFPSAFGGDKNMLICAPTGAGKTNIAMLAILRSISHFRNEDRDSFNLKKLKIVYIAPLKALVQEQVREFQRRLTSFGVQVAELTGDSNLTGQQIAETHILVSTPEKWDVITRKNTDTNYTSLVNLIIIDEVHLLHDERGPVLESIVARSLRQNETDTKVRLVALSATLPNYKDVARFLRVEREHMYYFDSSFRPCPLAQQFCGVTERNGIKKVNAMNEVCYDKILEAANENHQVIIFVHSRKDTARTARWLKDKLLAEDKLGLLIKSEAGSQEILKREAENVQDASLSDLIKTGFGIHHAGLSRGDRSLSEDLFADGLIQVLVSTATLAWGVNLPAHTVIIKGTEIYSPEKGNWTQLSAQDVLQMLGRAGRPRYDTNGEGIIITHQANVQYYLAVLNQQLPIESQLMSRLTDNLNAEIVLGNVKTRNDAIDWLGYTYLYVRMLEAPTLYNVNTASTEDKFLHHYRADLVHTALRKLSENHLIIYDEDTGHILYTELGRIASHFYIKYRSIAAYNNSLDEHLTQIEILRIFASSDEFKYMPVRQEEKVELQQLLEKAPIPIKETADDPLAKINILLQSYISKLKLDAFALNADMIYITQSAGRLLRALFEICLRKGWPRLTKMLLGLSKSVEKRIWATNSAFRQFPNCPSDVIRRAEASSLPWKEYFTLTTPNEVGQALRSEKHGKLAYDLLQRFPRLDLRCTMQPLTPSLLKFELVILPKWMWDVKVHGYSESFILMVEDAMGEKLLYTDSLTVKKDSINLEHYVDFTISLNHSEHNELPPNYFISIISEKWLHCEQKVPVLLTNVRLPKKFPAPTPLLDVDLVPVSELGDNEFISAMEVHFFNKFQSQTFPILYNTNENILVGASKGCGKTGMAELAVLNHWRQNRNRAVYICPSQDKIDALCKDWNKRFSNLAGGKSINKLQNDLSGNLRLLAESHLILSTPDQFDMISRRWKQRKNVQRIDLLIADDVHHIGNGMRGAVYESIISRMVFISAQLESNLRIIGLANSLASGRDFGEWMGVSKANIFNFSSQERTHPLTIHMKSLDFGNKSPFSHSILKMVYESAKTNTQNSGNSIIFVPGKRQGIEVGLELAKIATFDGVDLLRISQGELKTFLSRISDNTLEEALKNGIGIIYKGMNLHDKATVERLYKRRALSFVLMSKDCLDWKFTADFVSVLGTKIYEGREHRLVDYTINDLLEMISFASSDTGNNRIFIVTDEKKSSYFKKFLSESLPVESFMYFYLHDAFSNEISTSIIESKQDCIDWITYTYFYRRIHANPSFYGVKDISPIGISAYLTELVEEVIKDLTDASIIEVEEMNTEDDSESATEPEETISPLNGCLIGAYHNVSFATMHEFMLSLSKASGLKSILEILSQASEFEIVPIREGEVHLLKALYRKLPLKSTIITQTESSPFKTLVLLQAYFSRLPLPLDFRLDLKEILRIALPLINAIVDILSGEGHLNATVAMDISQMLVQGVWDTDSPLRQIPYFNAEIIKKCQEMNVETVYDIMSLEDEERDKIITMEGEELSLVANFVNSYPNIELSYSLDLSEPFVANEAKKISVTLTRDEEPEILEVVSEKFPHEKKESWWIVIGEASLKELYSIKKVSLSREAQSYDLEVVIPESGAHKITLWCVCDSYLDADKEVSFEIEVN